MEDGKISEFLEMQRILAETKGWSDQFTPEHAPMSLLWSIEEIGEAVAVIKKKGGDAIMQNESVRAHFIEECADIFMYLFDVFLSYGITSEEFYAAYRGKFQRNMGRDWREKQRSVRRLSLEAGHFRRYGFRRGSPDGIFGKNRRKGRLRRKLCGNRGARRRRPVSDRRLRRNGSRRR